MFIRGCELEGGELDTLDDLVGVVLTAAVHLAVTGLAGGLETGLSVFTGVEDRAACSEALGDI